jgi:hypothetical protein
MKSLLRTGGIEQVRWPVRLGDRHSANDGLVGFFTGDPQSTPRPFYASWGIGQTQTVFPGVVEYAQSLFLDCLRPVQITLLMDPQARVHATSGVLPRTFLELAPDDAARAKGAREVFFQAAPVLGPLATPQIPKPSDDYGEWSWSYRPAVRTWEEQRDLGSASGGAGFSDAYPIIAEGWLKLKIDPVQILGFWVRETTRSTLTFAWSVRGADSIELCSQAAAKDRIQEWSRSQAPLPREYTLQLPVDSGAKFVLTARDAAGYTDEKTLTIEFDDNAVIS